jgi:ribosomal protein L32
MTKLVVAFRDFANAPKNSTSKQKQNNRQTNIRQDKNNINEETEKKP